MKLRIPLAVVAATLLMPATAFAADPPIAGCGAGKELLTIGDTLEKIDDRIFEDTSVLEPILKGVDANGDDHLCVKQFAPNRGQDNKFGVDDYVITQVLDNKSLGRPSS